MLTLWDTGSSGLASQSIRGVLPMCTSAQLESGHESTFHRVTSVAIATPSSLGPKPSRSAAIVVRLPRFRGCSHTPEEIEQFLSQQANPRQDRSRLHNNNNKLTAPTMAFARQAGFHLHPGAPQVISALNCGGRLYHRCVAADVPRTCLKTSILGFSSHSRRPSHGPVDSSVTCDSSSSKNSRVRSQQRT